MRLGIIGAGRAAWAFGRCWQNSGWPVSGLVSRPGSENNTAALLEVPVASVETLVASSDLILVAVHDRVLPEVAARLASAPATVGLFHPSGSVTSQVFGERALRFSLHPLRSLPEVGTPVTLADTFFVFEGTDVARITAQAIVERFEARLGAVPPEHKALYHAAAVLGSNHVAALLEISVVLMEKAGLPGDPVRTNIAALAHSAIEVWLAGDGQSRFTGPIARGDEQVVQAHLAALESEPEVAALYRKLGDQLRLFAAPASRRSR